MIQKRLPQLCFFLLLTVMTTVTFSYPPPPGKGKDGDGGGNETPPIYYQAHQFAMPFTTDWVWLFDGNNLGQAVGGVYGLPNPTTNIREIVTPKGITDQVAFFYDPAIPTVAFDLNEIVEGIPDHLLIRRATSINEEGYIAVYLDNPDDTVQNFFPGIVDTNASPPQLHLIDFDWVDDGTGNLILEQNTLVQDKLTDYDGDYGIPIGLNDVGDMLVLYRRNGNAAGLYVFNFGLTDLTRWTPKPVDLDVYAPYGFRGNQINNPTADHEAQVILLPFNSDGQAEGYPLVIELAYDETTGLTPGSVTEITPQLSASGDAIYGLDNVRAINNDGTVLGAGYSYNYKRGKITGQASYAGLLWNGTYTELSPEVLYGGRDLNDDGDVIADGVLEHADAGALDILQLLDPNDPETSGILNSIVGYDSVEERTETGFPLILGTSRSTSDGVTTQCGVLYMPVPVPTEN